MYLEFTEHNCTDCGFNLVMESNGSLAEFKAPVVDDDGEIADLIVVSHCPHCGARLDDQVRTEQ